jgi:hypothetical protein
VLAGKESQRQALNMTDKTPLDIENDVLSELQRYIVIDVAEDVTGHDQGGEQQKDLRHQIDVTGADRLVDYVHRENRRRKLHQNSQDEQDSYPDAVSLVRLEEVFREAR